MADKVTEFLRGQLTQQTARAATATVLPGPDPDAVAEGLALGSQLGVPPSVVTGAPDVFRKRAQHEDAKKALDGAPKTQSWLQDRLNAAIAKDDLDSLSWFEKNVRNSQFGAGVATGIDGMKAIGTAAATVPVAGAGETILARISAYESLVDSDEPADRLSIAATLGVDPSSDVARYAFMFAGASPEQRTRMMEREVSALTSNKEFMAGILAKVEEYQADAQASGSVANTADFTDIENVKGFVDWLSFNSGQAIPYLAALAALGAVTGGAGLAAGGYALGVGDIQAELIEKGMTPQEAATYSLAGGIPYAALEKLGPAASITRGVRSEVLDRVARGYFQRLGREIPKQAVEEFINEAGQEIIKDFTVAGAMDESVVLNSETLERWFNSGMAGAAGGVSMSPITAAAEGRVGRRLDAADNAGGTAAELDAIDEMAAKSKLKQRSPDKFQEALEAQGDASFYVPADDLKTYFQAKDVPDDEMLAAWGIDADTLADAELTGGNVAIPKAVYAARISGTDDAAWFRDNAVTDPDEMSLSEAARFNEMSRDVMQAAFEDAEAQRKDDLELRAADVQIYDNVFSQLRAAGRTRDVADNEARVWSSFWRTMGERYDADPLELARSMGVRIEGPQTPDAARRRGNLDIMLNTLRSKGEKALKPRGIGILDFTKSEGGIQDRGGELEGMDLPKGVIAETSGQVLERESQPSMVGGASTGSGMALDELGRKLIEAGYFPEYMGGADITADGTVVDEAAIALEAISEAASGRDRFPDGEGPDADLVALYEALNEGGIDLALSNDDIAAALEGGATYNQFAGPQSKTANIHELASAKDMLAGGRSPELVRKETGWFAGADGKWRYEISDDKAKLVKKHLPSAIGGRARLSSYVYLSDFLRHDALFAAYPRLRYVNVIFDPNLNARGQVDGNGGYIKLNPRQLTDADMVMSTLLHEIQHLIQNEEGFAQGGNLEITAGVKAGVRRLAQSRSEDVEQWLWRNTDSVQDAKAKQALSGYANMFKSYEALIGYSERDSPSGVLRLIRNESGWLYSDMIQGGDADLARRARDLDRRMWELPKRHKSAERNRFLSEYSFALAQIIKEAVPSDIWSGFKSDPRKMASMVKAYEREASKARKALNPLQNIREEARAASSLATATEFKSPFEVYQSLAGEVEARNTQARRAMTDDERRESRPSGTQDKNAEEIIVVFGDGELTVPHIANSVDDPRILYQGERASGPLAEIRLPKAGLTEGQTVISLFESANLSSFLHESGHFFLEAFNTLATSENAPDAMKDDLAAILKFLDVKDVSEIGTPQHEKWARGFEAYLMEGKAPSLALADSFARFKAWLTRIYKTIAGLNVKVTPEIREVMDRMLATDAEIAEAQATQDTSPLFTSQAAAGMSQAAWNAYQRTAQRATEQASQALLEKTMAKVRREKEKWWKSERKDVRKEVEQSVNSRREYRLIEAITNKTWIGADREVPDFQMDRDELVEMFGDGVLKEIGRQKVGGKRALYAKGGDSLGVIADFFGFKNPSEMVNTLQNAGKRKAVIEAEVDRIMADRYGDPLNDGTIEQEAVDAIHSEEKAKSVVSEARHLSTRAGRDTRNLTAKVFRQRARMMIGRMTVRDATRPDAFLAAERKAAKGAEDSFARVISGRSSEQALATAARYKEQQVLNHYLYLESRDLTKLVASKREKMRDYGKKSVREKLEGGYIEQIDAILSDYDFRKRSPGQIDRSEKLADFVKRMEADGRLSELAIDERLIDQANAKHYTRMTVGELHGLFDTIANIDKMGRFKQKLIEAQRKRVLAESVGNVVGAIRKNHKKRDPSRKYRGLQFLNLIRRPDTILVSLDGGEELGVVYDELKRSVDEGQAREQVMGVEMVEKMDALFSEHYSKADLRKMQRPKSINGDPEREWSKVEIIAVALNTGNQDNFQRLMAEDVHPDARMTQARLDALLAQLDENDWRFIQGMWDQINSLWPDLAAIHKRRTGVEPAKVDAMQMVDAPAFVRGGYYPIKYDPAKSAAAQRDEESMWDAYSTAGHGATAAVNNGMTKQRMKNGNGRTLMFDLSVPFQHMRETVRYIALSEAVDASSRILRSTEVVEAFQEAGMQDTQKTLELWLKDTARGPIFNTDLLNSTARVVKNNFTMSKLAFNLKTVFLQVTGLGQAAAVIGKRAMVRGAMKYAAHPNEMIADVVARSALMAERQTTFQKDIYDFMNDARTAGPLESSVSNAKTTLAKAGFWPMIKTQFLVVDMPTWVGAYDAALTEGKSEADAAHYADRMVVRAQDSGLFADRAAAERGTVSENVRQADFIRVFTTLAGYMLTKNNRAQVTLMQARRGFREADSATDKAVATVHAASDLMLLFAFEAMVMGLMYALMTDEEDDEDLQKFMLKETGMAVVGGIPMIRDAASAFNGYGGGGVYGSVMETAANLTVQINQGEFDKALRRSLGEVVGVATGLPTTAPLRLIEGINEGNTAEALFGTNPLTR